MSDRHSALLCSCILLFCAGCLLFIPSPEIAPIPDQVIGRGEELTISIISSDPKGREITVSYTIDSIGWEPVTGNIFAYIFEDPGEHQVTIFASNGLKQAETSFMVTVLP